MRRNIYITLALIIILFGLAATVVWPGGPDLKIGSWEKKLFIHEGLDLKGGAHIVYEADLSKIPAQDQSQAISGVINVIRSRIDKLGVTEPVIQSRKFGGNQGVVIDLPGITDVKSATDLIGRVAKLDFREQSAETNIGGEVFQETGLTGANLTKADVTFDQQGNAEVSIEFNSEGAKLFGEITKRDVGKPLAIFLDDELISAPTVQTEITGGKAVITGKFSIDQAKQLAIQLNSGALPVPIKIIEQRNIGPSLGGDSVQRSLLAGIIGILIVVLFMILYYRLPGLLASVALLIYATIVIALFKLIPVTLTLAGIAGFILSVGMAVDANILIFERMKEELREGKPLSSAIDEGFRRAWNSIRDSNISSLITCLVLFWFGTGIIRGFALTLALGILVSMFTAIIVTRTFLKLVERTPLKNRLGLFIKGLKVKEQI